jgi:hypothetical protein
VYQDVADILASRPPDVIADPDEEAPWEQTRWAASTKRWNVVVCSRRAGKTAGAVRRALAMLLRKPGARVLYIHVRLKHAREQFWHPFLEYARSRGVVGRERHDVMQFRMRDGGFLRADACQDVGDLSKFRGDQWDLVILDEAQEHEDSVVASLVDQCLIPSLGDRHGGLDICGTPPPEGPVGYLWDRFDESGREDSEWTRWHWTLRDNPYFPQDEIDEICRARGIGPGHPVYEREIAGRFVSDAGSLVYEYVSPRNDATGEHVHTPDWSYSMGIDLGFADRDAVVVLGWDRKDGARKARVVYEWQENHKDVDQLSAVVLATYQRFRPVSVIGDTGGHGAVKVLETLKARLGGIEFGPKPASVAESVAILNDDMRMGRLLVDPTGELAADMKRVVWELKNGKRTIGKKFHSDITEAFRYAHWASYAYLSKAPPKKPLTEAELFEERLKRRHDEQRPRRRW